MNQKTAELSGRLFDIQRFSLDDGPGIRTVVFLKGCNMSCSWCHNPESISSSVEIFRTYSLCTGCKTCIEVCSRNAVSFSDNFLVTDYNLCNLCGDCIAECPASCIKKIGYDLGIDELIEIIKKDEDYYKISGGGVTFSGGEPTLKYEFLSEALKRCKENNINTVLDTNGTLQTDKLTEILPYIDTVLLDLKHTDNQKHRTYTGIDNSAVLETLFFVAGRADVEVRVPVIPSFHFFPAFSSQLKGKMCNSFNSFSSKNARINTHSIRCVGHNLAAYLHKFTFSIFANNYKVDVFLLI